VFPPQGAQLPGWIGGYGSAPFAVDLGGRRARVFFSGRDAQNRAQVGACTIDLDTLAIDADSITREPLVAPGPPGSFDESGCTVSCIVRDGEQWLLYYTGWRRGRTVPFYLACGLAISDDGGRSFRKHSLAPLLDRSPADPFLTASPSVMFDRGIWRMWYLSATSWEPHPDGVRHFYLVKYAEADDPIHWRREGHIAIPFEHPDEYAIGRPHVVKDGSTYRMWYCIRGDQYRLGHAVSDDGISWRRTEEVPPARSEWDSDMQAYPMILRDRRRFLMFYNGNRYGGSGFGCAETETRD
jgi:hypothetical protein